MNELERNVALLRCVRERMAAMFQEKVSGHIAEILDYLRVYGDTIGEEQTATISFKFRLIRAKGTMRLMAPVTSWQMKAAGKRDTSSWFVDIDLATPELPGMELAMDKAAFDPTQENETGMVWSRWNSLLAFAAEDGTNVLLAPGDKEAHELRVWTASERKWQIKQVPNAGFTLDCAEGVAIVVGADGTLSPRTVELLVAHGGRLRRFDGNRSFKVETCGEIELNERADEAQWLQDGGIVVGGYCKG